MNTETKKVRDLKTDPYQFKGYREFNCLVVTNLMDFLEGYGNHIDYYMSAIEIIADLEKQVKYANDPPSQVFVDYKPDGLMIFELVSLEMSPDFDFMGEHYEGDKRIVKYEFTGGAS